MISLIREPRSELHSIGLFSLLACAGWLMPFGRVAADDQKVKVTVGADAAAADLAPQFTGLSYETSMLLPRDGKHYFDPNNAALKTLFHTLGIKSLRLGGSSVDDPKIPIPVEADVDSLFAFAKVADVKVIYSFRLQQDPDASVALATYIYSHYADLLDSFCIGNEPDQSQDVKTYEKFHTFWQPQYEAISKAVPNVKFGGPSATHARTALAFIKEYSSSGKLAFVSDHHYYIGRAPDVIKDTVKGREDCLSDAFHTKYQASFDEVAGVAAAAGLPYRMDETNSCSRGGAADVSDTYAASLWALDYLHWWAAKHVVGINFHTGDRVMAGKAYHSPGYALFITNSTGSGFDVLPMSYAVLGFTLGAHGKPVPVTLDSPTFNFDAYGFRDSDTSLYLTLINRSHAPVDVAVDALASKGGVWTKIELNVPGDDVAAKTGMTWGGAPVASDGTWSGQWTKADLSSGHVGMNPVSATVLHWTAK